MKRFTFFVAALICAGLAAANATEPKSDLPGAKDSPLLGRFAGAYIVSSAFRDFDEMRLPLAALKPSEDKAKRDAKNNTVFEPGKSKALEGRRTRLVYLLPPNVSPLQGVRNYQNEIAGKGGQLLYECQNEACGGDPGRASEGGGGEQSLAMVLWPESSIKDKAFSNGHCAQTQRISEQRFAAFELPKAAAHVAVLAYSGKGGSYCNVFADRTVLIVDILEQKAMEQTMVTVKAEEMAQAINTAGRVALYGLYFDSGKAEVKPESKATLEQIAKLLAGTPSLKLLVVGHTDDVGGFASNMDLSKRRAESVIAALAGQYRIDRQRLTPVGVSFASPVAPNTNEDGRAKNRRVELVPNK